MTKPLFRVFSILMNTLLRLFLLHLCLVNQPLFADEKSVDFFYKKETLQPEIRKEPKKSPPVNSLSESYAPKTKEKIEGINFLSFLSEEVSWFFQKKRTPHKIALTPIYSYNQTQGSRIGLRFFSYSSDLKGYYFAFSGSQYFFRPFSRLDFSYIGDRTKPLRTKSSFIYDNHYENYFGKGMNSKLSDLKKIYSHHFMTNYSLFYQVPDQSFYLGLKTKILFRKERPDHQEGKTYFDNDLLLYLKIFIGYDSRDNWKNPKQGAFHKLSFGCIPSLLKKNTYCKAEGDLRFYASFFKHTHLHPSLKNSVFALRAFTGFSFLNPSPYSLMYSLGGYNPFQNFNSLRGFKKNRFLGDKIYFMQTEIRVPIWKKYLGGVLFIELGEIAEYKKEFAGFLVDYGAGLRVGLPPNYDMKIRMDWGTGLTKQKKRVSSFTISVLHAF